jgi:single-strand DNA-binding protein
MINKVILIGNIGRDPEVRHLENGAIVAKMSVATNESYQDKDEQWKTLTEWHEVVLWRQLAQRAEKVLKKGMLVYIEGKLTHRSWEDKNGIKRYATEVVAKTMRRLTKIERDENYFPQEEPVPPVKAEKKEPAPVDGGGENNGDEDDLPF